jgi:hypothetical protein
MKSLDFSAPNRFFFGSGELRRLREIAPITGSSMDSAKKDMVFDLAGT